MLAALGSFPVFKAPWYLESYCSSVQTLDCKPDAPGLTSKLSSAKFKTQRKIACIGMHKALEGRCGFSIFIIIFIYLFVNHIYRFAFTLGSIIIMRIGEICKSIHF